jgi:hypothetical protein
MASNKRVSVQHEEDESQNSRRRISSQEMETGGDTHVSAVVVPPQGSTNLASLLVKDFLDPELAEKRIDELLALEVDQEENHAARDDFKSTDICKNLVAAMDQQNANSNSASFLRKCCKLIYKLVFKSDHFTTGFRLAGAVKAIGISMEKTLYHKGLQRSACLALRNLAINANQSDAKKMIDDGAIGAVFGAMKCHPENNGIQERACAFLYNIMFEYPTCAIELMENDCIESVLKAMEAHLIDKEIQKWACLFLIELSEAKPDALKRINEKDGVFTLAKVKKHYRGKDADIESKADKLLQMIYK